MLSHAHLAQFHHRHLPATPSCLPACLLACCPRPPLPACCLPPGAQVSLFEGTCYLTPIIGAVLADSYWGRYKTIKVFSSIYLVVSKAVAGCLSHTWW